MIDLTGKCALVFGVASEDSIAWAITNWIIKAGGTCVLSYQKRFRSRLFGLTKDVQGIEGIEECDVAFEEEVKDLFNRIEGKFDMIVHAVGYAPATALGKPVIFTTEEDFTTAMVISAYSLQRVCRHAMRKLNPNSSVITLTYLASQRVVPGYRIMATAKAALESLVRELSYDLGAAGHRINAVSSGPVRTIAASNVPGFDNILGYMSSSSPMRKNIDVNDTAKASLFLLSDMASGITGQTIYVDAGFSISALPDLEQMKLS